MDSSFRFKRFSLHNEASAFKVGTDAVLLGACMTLEPAYRHLLDIGTGTGVIALLAAQRLSELGLSEDFRIDAVEVDDASAAEAALNFSESPWGANLNVIRADFLNFSEASMRQEESHQQYDCIFSNPPYFDESLRNPDERESAARHTETLSYREICAFASKALRPGGRLSLVLPSDSEKALIRCAASYSLCLERLLRVRTSPRKPVKRIIAEFRTAPATPAASASANSGQPTSASANPSLPTPAPQIEEIDLQKPNPTDKYYL